MAVVSAFPVPAKRAGSSTFSGGKLERSYTRVFQFRCDSASDEESVIEAHVLCPRIGSSLASNLNARCRSKTFSEITPGTHPIWEVTAEYSTLNHEFPWYPYRPAIWSGTSGRKEIAAMRDLDGKPILNSATDIYDPPEMLEIPIFSEQLSVSLPDGDFSTSWLAQYALCVNSSNFRGWSKAQALVAEVGYQDQYYTDEDGVEYKYYDVNIKFDYLKDEHGWQPYILSRGTRQLKDGQKVPIYVRGDKVTQPMPLDENGLAITGDDTEDRAHWTLHKGYNEVNLSPLDFS